MKKICLLITGLFLLVFANAQKMHAKPSAGNFIFNVKSGDVLTYEVNAKGETYTFEVTVKENRAALVFDWIMPEKDISGEVTLEKEARASATIYKNLFSNGEEWDFKDSSTVWFSHKNYAEAKKGITTLTMDDSSPDKFKTSKGETFTINYKGKQVKLSNFKLTESPTEGDKHSLVILDNPANPLILQMNLGWTIVLKEVK